MRTPGRLTRVARVLAVVSLLAAAGCLPIPYTVVLSPPIEGLYVRGNGIPVAGAQVALSTVRGDSTCAKLAASATTDAAGRFELPATTRRMPGMLLIPFTPAAPYYRICIGSADTLSHAYDAHFDPSKVPTHVLRCTQPPESHDSARITCTGAGRLRLESALRRGVLPHVAKG